MSTINATPSESITHRTRCITEYDFFTLWQFGPDRGGEMTRFVYDVYYPRFSGKYGWQGEDFDKMSADDLETMEHSTIYTAVNRTGSYLGTIRIIEKTDQTLPMERDFHLDALEVCRSHGISPHRIFEIARFAKSSEEIQKAKLSIRQGMAVTDALIAHCVRLTSRERGNIWVASIDIHVLELLRRRGFRFFPIGETADYLGSPTTPVMLPIDTCLEELRPRHPERYALYFEAAGDMAA